MSPESAGAQNWSKTEAKLPKMEGKEEEKAFPPSIFFAGAAPPHPRCVGGVTPPSPPSGPSGQGGFPPNPLFSRQSFHPHFIAWCSALLSPGH